MADRMLGASVNVMACRATECGLGCVISCVTTARMLGTGTWYSAQLHGVP
jgi:hypothetical protein